MTINILIPCGGEQERWGHDSVKQLVDINGEPLLLRTMHMIHDVCEEPHQIFVLADRPEICDLVPASFPHDKSQTTCLCNTLSHCQKIFGAEKTIVILGDVCFSINAMRQAFAVWKEQGVIFYGKDFEVFGVSFDKSIYNTVISSMEKATRDFTAKKGRGKLWEFYRLYNNITTPEHDWGRHPSYHKCTDWSMDFDRRDQYDDFIKGEM